MDKKLNAWETESFFCLAILPEGTDAVARILKRFLDYRQRKEEIINWMTSLGRKVEKEGKDEKNC